MVYLNSDETGGRTTSFAYTWIASLNAIKSITTTLPTVTTGQNGPNSADVETLYFDDWGRPEWFKDADGFLSYVETDLATGGVKKVIADLDTSQTGDYANKPSVIVRQSNTVIAVPGEATLKAD